MKPTYLAIISGIILSLDQVLLKILINKIDFKKINFFYNWKILLLISIIIFLGFIALGLWFVALKKVDLINIYWTTSIYYVLIPLFSLIILNENISRSQTIGYAIISIGALVASI